MADTSVCKTVDSAISQIYKTVYKIELLLYSGLSFVSFYSLLNTKMSLCHVQIYTLNFFSLFCVYSTCTYSEEEFMFLENQTLLPACEWSHSKGHLS